MGETPRQILKLEAKLNYLKRQRARMQSLERKADTRRKIELGGLVKKAGLDTETTAVLYGALLEIVERLQAEDGNQQRTIWCTSGDLAFRDEGAGHID